MSRFQLALNVSDLDTAVDFYRKLFNTEPVKRRPGYANFAIVQPPLKLVLFENPAAAGTLNHLGVEVETTDEVTAADDRFRQVGLTTRSAEQVTCCYALQNKVWVQGPDNAAWEFYAVLADSTARDLKAPEAGNQGCCQSASC